MSKRTGVFAGVTGRVRNISYRGEYGATVFIVADDNSMTVAINHVDKVLVKVGQRVIPNSCIGFIKGYEPWWFR